MNSPFFYYIRKNKKNFILGVISLAVTNVLDALPPYFIGRAIDQIAQRAPFQDILETVGIIFIITFFLAFARYSWRLHWGQFSHTSAMDLQNRIFSKFTQLGQTYLRKTPVGELMSTIINDTQSFRMGIGPGILTLLDAIFILMIVPPLMFSISPDWTWKTLILMPILPFFAHKMMVLLENYYEKKQSHFAELSGFAQEIIAGLRIIRAYAQQRSFTRVFNRYSKVYENTSNKTAFLDAAFTPPLEFAVTCGCVILLIIGSDEVISGAVSIGSFFAFYQYIQRMDWPATAIGIGMSHIQQGHASFRRIRRLLDQPEEVIDTGNEKVEKFEKLELINVSHSYDGEKPSLQDIQFELKAGEILGVVGPTASGKSTLIDLISRVLNPIKGTILINGHPITSLQMRSLRELVSVVPQESFLFSDKVSNNVAFGKNLSSEKMDELINAVDLSHEIQKLPISYETFLGERGVNLSGGQKQRLTLARALARQTQLILIDDSLSAVDIVTEEKILKQLRALLTTAVVISHRIDSVKWAHKVLVLKDGRQEAIGTHDELLKISPTYKNLYQLQKEGASSESAALH